MPQLIRRHRADDGATTMLVAFFFGTAVFVTLLALVIDLGALRLERRQLQNGADAAAVQAAQDCALNGSPGHTCGALAPLIAIASLNSSHGSETVTATNLCGQGNAALSACTAPGTLQNCPTTPTQASWVQVTTSTWWGGTPFVPQFFSRSLMAPHTEHACAQAAWGAPSLSVALMTPFAISGACWAQQTAGRGNFGPLTWSSSAAASYETVTTTTYSNGNTSSSVNTSQVCGPNQTPGGFGSLAITSGCTPSTFVSGTNFSNWLTQQQGNSLPCNLSSLLGKLVVVPIYDCAYQVSSGTATGTGMQFDTATSQFDLPCTSPFSPTPVPSGSSNIFFHVVGMASYYFAGYDFGNSSTSNTPQNAFYAGSSDPFYPNSARKECTNNVNCIFGWYTQQALLAPTQIDATQPNFGLSVVIPVG